MSQNSAIQLQLQHIGFTIQYRDELTAVERYLRSLGAVLPAGKHAEPVPAIWTYTPADVAA